MTIIFQWFRYQWHRVIWAFDHDGAVWLQGFTSLVTACLTAALIWVTWRYVHLTQKIADTNLRQLAASMQPSLSIRIHDHAQLTSSTDVTVACVLEIRNCGNHPIKLPAITAVLVYVDNSPGSIVTVTSQDNVVLMNGDVQQHKLFLIAQGKKELRSEDYIVGVSVDCCDLAGVSQHSFYFDDRSGLRHYFGFKAEEPPRALRKLLKAIKRASNVMGAGLKLK